MFSIEADNKLINSLLKRIPPKYQLEYRHGCILGKAKIPIGAVSLVVIPSCNGSHLVFTIPFKEIKGDMTGKFFLSKLISTFWGTIAKQVEAVAVPRVVKMGLPRNTVTTEKLRDHNGDVGKIKVSLQALNSWLSGKHHRLTPTVTDVAFTPEGVTMTGDVQTV